MTEQEWFQCAETRSMLRYLLGLRPDELRVQAILAFPACKSSDRKLRLFACACYHRLRHLVPDLRAATAIEMAERVADGIMPVEELQRAEANIRTPLDNLEGRWRASRGEERIALLPIHEALALGLVALWKEAQKAAYYASSNAYLAFAALANPDAASYDNNFFASRVAEERVQTDILRCMFGNPFRPITINPAWLTSSAVNIAGSIYDARSFQNMPVLADALEDAGCNNADILNHCRRPGLHTRGCWVVDLLLGKN